MGEKEFKEMANAIREKESMLDGECKHEVVIGGFSKHLMEKFGLLRYAGIKGKTRIVIEYDNDTGKGWRRIVSDDPITYAILKGQQGNQ